MIKKEKENKKTNQEEIVCLNFESKFKYEDWMSKIIEIKRKYGDQKQLQESIQLALKLGIKARSQEYDEDMSESEFT